MELIDTHAHLTSNKYDDIEAIVQHAQKNHVHTIINMACDLPSTLSAIQQANNFSNVYATAGIQPHDASSFSNEIGQQIKQLAINNNKVVAIGEIGLDAFHKLSPMPQQIKCFEFFLNTAIELNLPVSIHVRDTFTEVISILNSHKNSMLTGVIHCFTGNIEQAKSFLDLGYYISLSGIITFKSANHFVDIIKFIPETRLLIETDCPYLAPVPHRGKTNEPALLIHTCDFIANVKQTSPDYIANLTTQNARRLFSKIETSHAPNI